MKWKSIYLSYNMILTNDSIISRTTKITKLSLERN